MNTCINILFCVCTQEASTFDASQQLQYLEMVMDESTRLYTPVPRLVVCGLSGGSDYPVIANNSLYMLYLFVQPG